MFTFLTGWTIVLMKLGHGTSLGSAYMTRILTGGLMGTLMWANVWFVIWPAQQVVIANAERVAGGGQADPTAAARGARAGLASRINTAFSVAMLFFMAAGSHLPSLARGADLPGSSATLSWIVALLVMAAVEANALLGPGLPSQKPLATVSGTIHAGLGLTAVLAILMAVLV
jgi:uncharacterized membrane protein